MSMSLYDFIQEESVVQNLDSFLLISFIYPRESNDWLLFCLTLVNQGHMT